MALNPAEIRVYHVFIASPGDVGRERQDVRDFFEAFNKHQGALWKVRFEVIDWENYSSIGVGRPQELITQQTLERYRDSLALVVGMMAQRFGSPSGAAESGTEEEFNWALKTHHEHGWPEIKWFFREIDQFVAPPDLSQIEHALEQWKKVCDFQKRLVDFADPVFFTHYPSEEGFRAILEKDLRPWINAPNQPWNSTTDVKKRDDVPVGLAPPRAYFQNVERDFRRLDIAGIDNDRSFEIPLSEIYVRLRVMFEEDSAEEENGAIDIQTALLRYQNLVIVGDPGSGKSTFLKYIALMLSKSFLAKDPALAMEKLCLPEPTPIPIFLSCWDLADFLKQENSAHIRTLHKFIAERLSADEFPIKAKEVESLLKSGNCCLLFDGLDEVPSDSMRGAVSRLLEECIDRYSKNRFVITSRMRAYTGATILKGNFTRCDIQPFNAEDRSQFLLNWVALLFKLEPASVLTDEKSQAHYEYASLIDSVEHRDRIRPLAVNPLLLTVIAIVHWNRKRLPEQRVDLYDECVDVLLGQRKEAERIQRARQLDFLEESDDEQLHEDRAWVRKRFAEIALLISSQDGEQDEVTKTEIVKLLQPRFLDKGAESSEQANSQAERFLERQELRSGLLVSRKAAAYRFVHLTFQEYLAAWHLSKLDFSQATEFILPRLRKPRWFESLQLLGGEWAKESDERADQYVSWLLKNRGDTVSEQAPVVALCANVVRDIHQIADIRANTRRKFNKAVKSSLDVFQPKSGIDTKTQLEILGALGQLGAAAKPHLIDATRASLFQVRRRAIEKLLPHLSDIELFAADHILLDRSKEPIKTYLKELFTRDSVAATVLIDSKLITQRILQALFESREFMPDEVAEKYVRQAATGLKSTEDRITALEILSQKWPNGRTRKFLGDRAANDDDAGLRIAAIRALTSQWREDPTRDLLRDRATKDPEAAIRLIALETLTTNWSAPETKELLRERARIDGAAASLLGRNHSHFGSKVFWTHLHPSHEFRDPRTPIPHDHLVSVADHTSVDQEKLDTLLESLSETLGWDVTKGSSPQ